MGIITFILNYIIPIYALLLFVYYEYAIYKLRKKCDEGIVLRTGGLFYSKSKVLHIIIFTYIIILSLLWILHLFGVSSVIYDMIFKYNYVISLAFLALSNTIHVFVGNNGVLIGTKLIDFSQIRTIEIKYNDSNNPYYPLAQKVVFHFKNMSETKASYVTRKEIPVLIKIIDTKCDVLGHTG